MNISDITQQRLRIAINAVEHDPNVSSTLKMGFKTIYQCIYEQKLSTEIIQAELKGKANSTELGYALSQKLSVNQFLKYFQKIEKVVQGVQIQSTKYQERIDKLFQAKSEKNEQMWLNLKSDIQLKRKSKETEIHIIREQLQNIKDAIQQITVLNKKMIKKEDNKQNISSNNAYEYKRVKNSEMEVKYEELLQELKVVQQYCQESKAYLDTLAKNQQICINQSFQHDKYVSFNQLREIMNNLQDSLNQSVSNIVRGNIMQKTATFGSSNQSQQLRVFWQYNCFQCNEQQRLKFSQIQFRTNIYDINNKNSVITVKGRGVYQITCCFFPKRQAEISLLGDGNVLASHVCSQPPKHNMARTLMLYLRIQKQTELTLQCDCQSIVDGLLAISRL